MGNAELQVPEKLKQQWTEKLQDRQRYFYNKLTQEQFQIITLPESKSNLDISSLIQRSIYPMLKTPKVIVLHDKKGGMSVLVQRRKLTLREVILEARLDLQLFKIIRDFIAGFEALFRRFGPFGVNQRMMAGNGKSQVMVWINERFQVCQIQVELPKNDQAEPIMLQQIIKAIQNSMDNQLTYDVFNKPPSTYSGLIKKIQEIISTEREMLISAKNRSIGLANSLSSPLSTNCPQTLLQDKDEKIMNTIPQRRYNIPKFLKKNKTYKQQQTKGHTEGTQIRNMINKLSIQENEQDNNSLMDSVGKVRSLHVSPSIKSQSSKYTHSFATTNYSLLSQRPYPGTPETLAYSKDFRFPPPQRKSSKEEYSVTFHDIQGKQQRPYLPVQYKSSRNLNANTNNLSLKFNIQRKSRQKEKILSSYGSLNLHGKTFFECKQLCESKIEESGANEDYSMVIRDELQSFFGVQEEQDIRIDIVEEFNRIIA